MADDDKPEVKAAASSTPPAKGATATASAAAAAAEAEAHYEEVAEYRIGEGAPPIFLVICFLFIVIWAMFSWVPFFGY